MDEETFENDKIIDAILSEQLEETEILEKFNVAEKPSLMSAFISKDGNIKIILPEVQNEQKTEFNLLSKEVSLANIVKSPEPKIEPKCATKTPFDLMKPLQVFTDENENEYFEFKLSPRRVFMATVCQVFS